MIVIYLLLFSDAKFPPPVIIPPGYKPPKKCLRNNISLGLISGILRFLFLQDVIILFTDSYSSTLK